MLLQYVTGFIEMQYMPSDDFASNALNTDHWWIFKVWDCQCLDYHKNPPQIIGDADETFVMPPSYYL